MNTDYTLKKSNANSYKWVFFVDFMVDLRSGVIAGVSVFVAVAAGSDDAACSGTECNADLLPREPSIPADQSQPGG